MRKWDQERRSHTCQGEIFRLHVSTDLRTLADLHHTTKGESSGVRVMVKVGLCMHKVVCFSAPGPLNVTIKQGCCLGMEKKRWSWPCNRDLLMLCPCLHMPYPCARVSASMLQT